MQGMEGIVTIFSSLNFLFVFLPVCVVLYYVTPTIKLKNAVLVVLSLVFYAFGDPKAIFLLLFCTLANYIFGLVIGDFYSRERSALFTAIAVVFNVSVLACFKLMGAIFGTGATTIPLGVSFFTFQSIAYIVDVYRGKIRAQKNILDFFLFIVLFPQLIAGPILRYDDIAQQLKTRTHSWALASEGITRFVVGLSKKVVIADIAGGLVANNLGSLMSTPMQAWFGLLMFTFQIYFDFSGYSDMAIGLGKMFGFQYPENFNYPYTALSMTQFWRRWHITLSAFFRDYIYIPLGGNRRRMVFNLFVVWVVTALWHGIGIGFLLWGLYNFAFVILDKYVKIKLPPGISRVGTFLLVYFGWSFFYFREVGPWLDFAAIAFNLNPADIFSPLGTTLLINNAPFMLLCFVASTPVVPWLSKQIPIKLQRPLSMACSLGLLGVCTALIISQSYVPFLYYKF